MDQNESIKDIINKHSNLAQFSKCLGISRPTIYRYIEWFDAGDNDKIPEEINRIFKTLLGGNSEFRYHYFTELYGSYLEKQEAFKGVQVPKSIADQIDKLELTVDEMSFFATRFDKRTGVFQVLKSCFHSIIEIIRFSDTMFFTFMNHLFSMFNPFIHIINS